MTMKAKITRPDGTIIDLDGDPVHIQAAIAQLSPAPWQHSTVTPFLAPQPLGSTIFKSYP